MKREYRISEQPDGSVLVVEGLLDAEGLWVKGIWTTGAADIVSATDAIQEHEKQFRNRGGQFIVVDHKVYQEVK